MSIKVEMFIKLPYIIKLTEEKDYNFSFLFDDFEMFSLDMWFNDCDNSDIYNENHPSTSCSNIRIEAIYKYCNYLNYEGNRICYKNKNINEFQVKLPFEETQKVFNAVNIRMEEIFHYLRNKSNMFWIEAVPVKPVGYCYGQEIPFGFYSPNTRLSRNVVRTQMYTDYYMTSDTLGEIFDINDDIFDDFNNTSNKVIEKFNLYLHKAEKSLYERRYDDFIIYCSISVESFIRKYIGKIEPDNDIVFKRISSSNYDYLDQYYNVLLKYLKGKSLIELNESVYTHIKRMYILRNALMHDGFIDQKTLQKVGLSKFDLNECKKILKNVKEGFLLISEL